MCRGCTCRVRTADWLPEVRLGVLQPMRPRHQRLASQLTCDSLLLVVCQPPLQGCRLAGHLKHACLQGMPLRLQAHDAAHVRGVLHAPWSLSPTAHVPGQMHLRCARASHKHPCTPTSAPNTVQDAERGPRFYMLWRTQHVVRAFGRTAGCPTCTLSTPAETSLSRRPSSACCSSSSSMSPVADALARFRLPCTLLFSCSKAAFLNTSCAHQQHSPHGSESWIRMSRCLLQQARCNPHRYSACIPADSTTSSCWQSTRHAVGRNNLQGLLYI